MSTKMKTYTLVEINRKSGKTRTKAISTDPLKLLVFAEQKYPQLTLSAVATELKSSLGIKIFDNEEWVHYIEETKIVVLQ